MSILREWTDAYLIGCGVFWVVWGLLLFVSVASYSMDPEGTAAKRWSAGFVIKTVRAWWWPAVWPFVAVVAVGHIARKVRRDAR